MQNRNSFFLLIVIGLIAVITIIFWNWQKSSTMPPLAFETNSAMSSAVNQNERSNAHNETNNPLTQPKANSNSKPTQDKGDQMKEGLATANDIPIVFYGLLKDQFGNPVTDAPIAASVRVYNNTRSSVERVSVISDENGFFTVNHGKGESLSIVPSKKGYVLATKDTYFKYSYMYPDRISPDQNNPVVIKMWKLQGNEPLVMLDKTYKMPFTSAPINFDMIARTIVSSGGDVKITINRPDGIISQQHPQNWSIHFEVIGGGFIETSDKDWDITFAAPDHGYQADGMFANNNGPDFINKDLFIDSRNGQVYSKVGFSFRINDNPDDMINIRFNGVANTNSSRNWEATAPQ